MTTVVVAVLGSFVAITFGRAARGARASANVHQLGSHPSWRLPRRPREYLVRALSDAAVDLEPESACELWAAGTAALAVLTLAVAPGMVAITVLVGVVSGVVGLRVARHRARSRFLAALPGALEHVAAAMRGGASVHDAVAALADGGGPVSPDLQRVRARAELGLGLAEALATWPTERPLLAVRAAAGGLAVAASVGGASADAIDGLATSLRERLGAAREALALSAQARLSAIVVGAAPIGYLLLSALADPDSIAVLFATGTGQACLLVGVALEALAVVWMRRILREAGAE